MTTKMRSFRLEDDTYNRLVAVPGKNLNEKVLSLLESASESPKSSELPESAPGCRCLDPNDLESLIEATIRRVSAELRSERQSTPRTNLPVYDIPPGVTIGARDLPPPRRKSYAEQQHEKSQAEIQRRADSDSLARAAGRTDINYSE